MKRKHLTRNTFSNFDVIKRLLGVQDSSLCGEYFTIKIHLQSIYVIDDYNVIVIHSRSVILFRAASDGNTLKCPDKKS